MLTKDLLHYHISGGKIIPDLINPTDLNLLHFAERLLSLYAESRGMRRTEIGERILPEVNSKRDLKLARGILKVLDDRCDYSFHSDLDYPAIRHEIFAESAGFFLSGNLPEDMNLFREQITKNTPLQQEIYADLPENERLLGLRKTFPQELLERYNMELVRSLLLYSSALTITADAENFAELRRVFKYLRFFRLLCRASLLPKKKKTDPQMVSFVIDGPASILENGTKYGLQLACFFPAVCRLNGWSLASRVQFAAGKEYSLKLDHKSNLVCHFENFGAYIPEELKLFSDYFRQKSPDWVLTERQAWRQTGGELIFPDFSFTSPDGERTFDLELFHPWHKSRIRERLDAIRKGQLPNYLIGVDRSCIRKDPELSEELKASPHCMLFSNFPGVENVRKLLNTARENQ